MVPNLMQPHRRKLNILSHQKVQVSHKKDTKDNTPTFDNTATSRNVEGNKLLTYY